MRAFSGQSNIGVVFIITFILACTVLAGILLWQYDPLGAEEVETRAEQEISDSNNNNTRLNANTNADSQEQQQTEDWLNLYNQRFNESQIPVSPIDFFKNGQIVASGDTIHLNDKEVAEIRANYVPQFTAFVHEIDAQNTFYTLYGQVQVYQFPFTVLEDRIFGKPRIATPEALYTAVFVEMEILPRPVGGIFYQNWLGVEYNGSQQLWYADYLRGDNPWVLQYAVAGVQALNTYPHVYYFLSQDDDEYDGSVIDDELLVAHKLK